MITIPRSNTAPRIGIVGTGFLARGIMKSAYAAGYRVGPALTRRPIDSAFGFPVPVKVTNQIEYLIENSDLVVECSGDPIHATDVIHQTMEAGLPVVTMNSEFHITSGSWFAGKGILTEGEGDQPGCLGALRQEVIAMGFEPLVYGNVKGFLNHHPTRSDMEYYSQKQGTSLSQTTSFTDGTKLQIEQALVANAFGADIYRPGLLGPVADSVEDGSITLAGVADMHGAPISDYIILPGCGAVFITARHDHYHRPYLSYMKMGDGPFYTLTKNYHLCHLEVIKTVRNVLERGRDGILMNNTVAPRVGVAAIAKREMEPGYEIERGIGSFDFRGEALEIASEPDHVPIGLLGGARVRRKLRPGQHLTLDDVDFADTLATEVYFRILDQVKVKAA